MAMTTDLPLVDPGIVTLATVVLGLLVGVEIAVLAFLNPILDRLPDHELITARARGAALLGRVMPFWYATAIVLTWTVAVVTRSGPALTAGVLLLLSLLLTVVVLVPVNNRARTWSASQYPENWRRQLRRWDRWHGVRIGLIGAALVLLVLAVAG